MGKNPVHAVTLDDVGNDQRIRVIAQVGQELAQQNQAETLANHGGALRGMAVRRGQAVKPGQHHVVNRAGHRGLAGFGSMTQQLLQEKRVAVGLSDARLNGLLMVGVELQRNLARRSR